MNGSKIKVFSISLLLLAAALSAFSQSASGGVSIVEIRHERHAMGRGNAHELLLHFVVRAASEDTLHSLTIDLLDTPLADLDKLELYSTDTTAVFDERCPRQTDLLCSIKPNNKQVVLPVSKAFADGNNHFWLTCDVSSDAVEGDTVFVTLKDLDIDGLRYECADTNCRQGRVVLLARTVLYRPGDFNSANYRIPAILTSDDGNLVVTTDRRKNDEIDLPHDIDVICNVSRDGGRSWSAPYYIARGEGFGRGYGDAALVRADGEGGVMAVFCGGPGIWASSPDSCQRLYYAMSLDNGATWSAPVDFTDFIYGADCHDAVRKTWKAGFCASGNGLRTRNGRIMFVLAARETDDWRFSDYVVYTDDLGKTWGVSSKAASDGDEAKVVELADGRILMSIRHGRRLYNISSDNGMTWQSDVSVWDDLHAPACNGDIIRYRHGDADCLLQSLPYGDKREDVRVYASFDAGLTWPWRYSKCLVPGASAYSSLCVLPDGTIGLYVEEGEGGYSMVFYNFSLDWLMKQE